MKTPSLIAALLLATAFVATAEDLPPTLMTKCGKLLVEQNFEKTLPPFDGKSNGFASGFSGWRHNATPRSGHWDVVDGTFHGAENPEVHHPGTASYGFDFKNVVITVDVRMNDVPLDGRTSRYIDVRTTDTKDYVCSVLLNEKSFRIQKDDNDHEGPDVAVPLGRIEMPLKLGEWHHVVFEILGEEMVGTVDGRSLTGQHALIGEDKHSVMFVAGVDASFRNFKVWEALPNPDWAKNKATLAAATTTTKTAQ